MAVNFADVTRIKSNDGNVVKITDSNGKILWEQKGWILRYNGNNYSQYNLNDIFYVNNKFIATGGRSPNYGLVLTSPDGFSWTANTVSGCNFKKTIYAANKFVSICSNGAIFTSTDAVTWTQRRSMVANDYTNYNTDIIYANGMFVVTCKNSRVLTSTDATTWTERVIDNTVTDNILNSITYGGNKFVIAGYSGRIYTSSDGVNWTNKIIADKDSSGYYPAIVNVMYAKGLYIANISSKSVMTSSDAANWTTRIPESSDTIGNIYYVNNKFIIFGFPYILTSSDMISFNKASKYETSSGKAAYGDGYYVAMHSLSLTYVSRDGNSWGGMYYPTYSDSFISVNNILYANNMFIAVCNNAEISTLNKNSIVIGALQW